LSAQRLSTYISTYCLGGFEEKSSLLIQKRNELQQIQLSDTNGTSNGTGFCGQM